MLYKEEQKILLQNLSLLYFIIFFCLYLFAGDSLKETQAFSPPNSTTRLYMQTLDTMLSSKPPVNGSQASLSHLPSPERLLKQKPQQSPWPQTSPHLRREGRVFRLTDDKVQLGLEHPSGQAGDGWGRGLCRDIHPQPTGTQKQAGNSGMYRYVRSTNQPSQV